MGTQKTSRYGLSGLAESKKEAAALRVGTTVAAALGGAAVGAAVGKFGMLLGVAAMAVGAYLDKPQAIAAGAGAMFAGRAINPNRAAELTAKVGGGKASLAQLATARVKSLLDETKTNINPFAKETGMSGLGNTDYWAGAPQIAYTGYEGYSGYDNGQLTLDMAGFDDAADLSGVNEEAALSLL